MLPPMESEPRASDFTALDATELIHLFARSLSPLDPNIVMLYWFMDLEFFWNQQSMTT